MRAAHISLVLCSVFSIARGAYIPFGKRSTSVSSRSPTGTVTYSSSSRSSSQALSGSDSVYSTSGHSKSTSQRHVNSHSSAMTRTSSSTVTQKASTSKANVAPSSQTQLSNEGPRPSINNTKTSKSRTSRLIAGPPSESSGASGTASVTGLADTSTISVPRTYTSDKASSVSGVGSVPSSDGIPTATTSTGSSTEVGFGGLVTHSSRSIASVTTVTGVSSDSHTSTVGTDHHTTVIPIVGGSHCWFCPPGIHAGFGLIGMSVPGIYPPGPPPPGFPISLPAITIGPEGNPTYSSTKPDPTSTEESTTSSSTSSSATTSSSSCTITETASSCTVETSYRVDATDSTTATFTTTSCTPITVCAATGTTETTLTTSTMGASCYRFPDDTSVDITDKTADDSSSETKRDIEESGAGSMPFSLWRRGRGTGFSEFAGCELVSKDKKLNYPSHPGPRKIKDFMKERNTPLKGLYIVPYKDCGEPPEVTLLSDIDSLTSQEYYNKEKSKYSAMGTDKSPFVQTEHVYELQTVPDFLNYLIANNLISCEDMKQKLVPNEEENLAQELFNQLPSFANPDFVVLDNGVNNWKGKVLGGGMSSSSKGAQRIKDLYDAAMVFDYMRIEDVYTKFQTTNARIYEFLRDKLDSCGNQHAPKGGWAPAYTSFMSGYLSSYGDNARTVMSDRWTTANNNPKNGQPESDALSMLTERYPFSNWRFDVDTLLSWPSASASAAVGKRAACSLDATTSSDASSSQTSTQATGRSSRTRAPTSFPTSTPATPGSPISPQPSPTQTQAPANPFGTGEITGTSSMDIAIPTTNSKWWLTRLTNFETLPSSVEITTLPPATWISSTCFWWRQNWTTTKGPNNKECACFTWRATDVLEGNSANIEQVTAIDLNTYTTGSSCAGIPLTA